MNVVFRWQLPTIRESGLALLEEDIGNVEVSLSADDGDNFTVVADVAPPDLESPIIEDLENGAWIARFVVIDTEGKRGAAYDEAFVADESAPGQVTNVEVILT